MGVSERRDGQGGLSSLSAREHSARRRDRQADLAARTQATRYRPESNCGFRGDAIAADGKSQV